MTIPAIPLSPALDVVELTRALVAFDSRNPPGDEVAICHYIEALLRRAGFTTEISAFGENRRNLVARIGGRPGRLPIAFTGHMDTVPLGAAPWRHDPFAGIVEDGRLYGRGTCDMKGGLAAALCAAIGLAVSLADGPGVTFLITGGEETGSQGARHLIANGFRGERIGALVVAEPTDLVPLAGHKGALWLRATCTGVTAHGSMPERGDNAIYKAAEAIGWLRRFTLDAPPHPHLSAPTLNVGTISGGLNTNSVADRAEFTVDIRTVPDQDHGALLAALAAHLGPEVELATIVDLPAVWTAPGDPWFQRLSGMTAAVASRRSGVAAAPYFTDASVLTPYFGAVPTAILGPGSPGIAHTVDEYCEVVQLEQAVVLYTRLILDWYAQ